ncbi:TetR/AcrR family transcriptional regulator [Nocardia sp. MDA0666]|uniref:TetR/AcrR family transcriptional regulator n=1 Tax=Nocardia sp. MDA0666 TaxID=2135448 RepID=UPI0013049708|nr:TetR/AcrR family transcriptional regulator C-terminal domain-containing protein [Nocardia sp. MDA0666]
MSGGKTTESGAGIVQTSRRGRGRPPRLSRDGIVAAARALPPETLTMKAVADALGVDRKSLNYYVSDRDGLLELVALDAFETEIRRLDLSADGDWRQLLHLFAAAVAEALTQVGVLIYHVRFRGRGGLSTLAEIERIFQSLVSAGFEPMEAGRTLRLLADIAYSAARESTEANRGHVDLQAEHVARTLNAEVGEEFPLLRQVATTRESAGRVGEQFEFDVDLVIAGLERKLEARGRA